MEAGFNDEFRRDINSANGLVDGVLADLDTIRSGKTTADFQLDTVSRAGSALIDVVAQFWDQTRITPDFAADMVESLVEAVNMRLQVAQHLEDGAVGKESIRESVKDVAGILGDLPDDLLFEGLGRYYGGPIHALQNPVTIPVLKRALEHLDYWSGSTYDHAEQAGPDLGSQAWAHGQKRLRELSEGVVEAARPELLNPAIEEIGALSSGIDYFGSTAPDGYSGSDSFDLLVGQDAADSFSGLKGADVIRDRAETPRFWFCTLARAFCWRM